MLLDSVNKSVKSPCIRNCCLDDNDICVGCFRSLDEILQWGNAVDADKKLILQKANTRRNMMTDCGASAHAPRDVMDDEFKNYNDDLLNR